MEEVGRVVDLVRRGLHNILLVRHINRHRFIVKLKRIQVKELNKKLPVPCDVLFRPAVLEEGYCHGAEGVG